ncbi:tyrosyl-tRNA synthetase [Pseudohyphozyma bogoriensis]|nr:tyrosyl-tRNA synthetase [Pseudohyphozyma bogoriensis]
MSASVSTSANLTPAEKYELITQNLAEVLGGEQLKATLEERDLIAYWGTATTGRPHLGYFVPIAKLGDFISAGVEVKVLLADVHAFLDNLKAPIELIAHRADYYRRIITAVIKSLHLPLELLKFVVGSSYQYTPPYARDQLKLTSITSERDARKAGAEVVKQTTSPPLSGLLYPLLQALDEEYLGVDFQFGGVDQRKIFTYAELYLPLIGYKKRSHLMNTMVPGLAGGKMSSSEPDSKIDFLDGPDVVKRKIQKAVCGPGEVEGNGVLAFIRHVIIPIGALKKRQGRAGERAWAKDGKEETAFTVTPNPKFGGEPLHFKSADELEAAYAKEEVHPGDLKAAVIEAINALLAPIQKEFAEDEEFRKAEAAAYPVEVPVKEVKKKVKKYTPKPDHLKTPEERAKDAAAAGAAGAGGLHETEALREAIEETEAKESA